MTDSVKITPTRAAAINVEFREAMGERVPYQGRSNARFRMLDAMRNEGLLYRYESKRDRDGPEKPKEMQRGPTAKGLRAYIEAGYGKGDPTLERMEARIPELEKIEAEHEAKMRTFYEECKREREERAEQRYIAKIASFRELFAEEKIDLGGRSDDGMLALVERIVGRDSAL